MYNITKPVLQTLDPRACPQWSKTHLRITEWLACIQTIDRTEFTTRLHPRIDDGLIFVPKRTEYLSNLIYLLGRKTVLTGIPSTLQRFRSKVAQIWIFNDAILYPINGVTLPENFIMNQPCPQRRRYEPRRRCWPGNWKEACSPRY